MKFLLFNLMIATICSGIAHAQTVSGTWIGNSEKSLLTVNPTKIVVELHLYNDSLLTGVEHIYLKEGKYEHQKINGKYHKSDSTLVFSEDSVISYDYKKGWEMCQGVYSMKFQVDSSKFILKGIWKDKKKGMFRCPTVNTWFDKENPAVASKSQSTQDLSRYLVPNKEVRADVLNTERKIDIQKVIDVDSVEMDSIKVEIFDNGIVDDDTVSIYLNDNVLLKDQRVSEKPITFFIRLDKNVKFQKITMVANNLGSIPPNTAMLVINTRKKRYEVYLSSDLKKNAVVEFFIKD